jgi:hypothetical protein
MQTFVALAASAPLPGRILASLQVAAVALLARARLLLRWLAAHEQAVADHRALAAMSRHELRDIGIDAPGAADPYSRSLPDFRIQP